MNLAEVVAKQAAKAEAYKMVLLAQEAGASEEVIAILKAHADSL